MAKRGRPHVKIWREPELKKGGIGGILGVGQGSVNPPRMIELDYRGARHRDADRAHRQGHRVRLRRPVDQGCQGHGVDEVRHGRSSVDPRDDGGDRPAEAEDQRGGRDPVVGEHAERLGERPGDVLHHRGGKTSEVLNTDAEGRLVLADALAYLAEQKPTVDHRHRDTHGRVHGRAGRRRHRRVRQQRRAAPRTSVAAGDAAGEPMWQLPLLREYRQLIDSNIADVKNIGDSLGRRDHGRLFLEEFVGDMPWVHLDIAGPAFAERSSDLGPKGGDRRPGPHARALRPGAAPDAVPRWRRTDATGPVLGVFAHPDDAEIAAGGTLAKWAAAGREVHLLVLTNGDRGSSDPGADRAELAATRWPRRWSTPAFLGLASARGSSASRRGAGEHRTKSAGARSAGSARCVPRRSSRSTPPPGSSRTATTTTGPSDGRRYHARRGVPRRRQPAVLLRAAGGGTGPERGARGLARMDARAQPHRGRQRATSTRRSPRSRSTRASSSRHRRSSRSGSRRKPSSSARRSARATPRTSACWT